MPTTRSGAAARRGRLTALWTFVIAAGVGALPACVPPSHCWFPKEQRAELDRISRLAGEDRVAARSGLARARTDWPEAAREAVAAGEVAEGMTPIQVYAAWGRPASALRIWSQLHGGREMEEWTYGGVSPRIVIQFFENRVGRVYYEDAEYPWFAHRPPEGAHGYRWMSSPP